MSKVSVASRPSTRLERGIALFRERGEEIEHVEGWRWRVPSCSGSFASAYLVDLRTESCDCPDQPSEAEVCKHITAATIAHAKSEECSGCRKKVLRRHLCIVPEDHPTLGGLVEELCTSCAVSQEAAPSGAFGEATEQLYLYPHPLTLARDRAEAERVRLADSAAYSTMCATWGSLGGLKRLV